MGAKERFVKDTLYTEGRTLLRTQGHAISSGYRRGSGRLESGRHIAVSGAEDADGKLTFSHPIYERFLDIQNRRRKNKAIHNRFIFGMYGAVAKRLMYGFTEEVAELFREIDEA